MLKALTIQINWQFTGGAGIMQVEHTADCFDVGGAWLKSPLSTEVWHLLRLLHITKVAICSLSSSKCLSIKCWSENCNVHICLKNTFNDASLSQIGDLQFHHNPPILPQRNEKYDCYKVKYTSIYTIYIYPDNCHYHNSLPLVISRAGLYLILVYVRTLTALLYLNFVS